MYTPFVENLQLLHYNREDLQPSRSKEVLLFHSTHRRTLYPQMSHILLRMNLTAIRTVMNMTAQANLKFRKEWRGMKFCFATRFWLYSYYQSRIFFTHCVTAYIPTCKFLLYYLYFQIDVKLVFFIRVKKSSICWYIKR